MYTANLHLFIDHGCPQIILEIEGGSENSIRFFTPSQKYLALLTITVVKIGGDFSESFKGSKGSRHKTWHRYFNFIHGIHLIKVVTLSKNFKM